MAPTAASSARRPSRPARAGGGDADCEAQVKTDTQATIRNLPLDGDAPGRSCIRCDRPAMAEAWFAKSYSCCDFRTSEPQKSRNTPKPRMARRDHADSQD